MSGRVTTDLYSGKCWVTRGEVIGSARGDVPLSGVMGSDKGLVIRGETLYSVRWGMPINDGSVSGMGRCSTGGSFKGFLINLGLAGALLSRSRAVSGMDGCSTGGS